MLWATTPLEQRRCSSSSTCNVQATSFVNLALRIVLGLGSASLPENNRSHTAATNVRGRSTRAAAHKACCKSLSLRRQSASKIQFDATTTHMLGSHTMKQTLRSAAVFAQTGNRNTRATKPLLHGHAAPRTQQTRPLQMPRKPMTRPHEIIC